MPLLGADIGTFKIHRSQIPTHHRRYRRGIIYTLICSAINHSLLPLSTGLVPTFYKSKLIMKDWNDVEVRMSLCPWLSRYLIGIVVLLRRVSAPGKLQCSAGQVLLTQCILFEAPYHKFSFASNSHQPPFRIPIHIQDLLTALIPTCPKGIKRCDSTFSTA